MPRGVPASGKRQPRAVAAPEPMAEGSVAGSAVDWSERVESSAEDEAAAQMVEADDVMTEVPELTAEQLEIQSLRDQLAQVSGRKDVEPIVEDLVEPGDEKNILIHFLVDGFTALGKVWYRGQELEFGAGSQAYKDTFDRRGVSWLSLRNDDFAQVERWGQIIFRNGPWPGKTYADGTFEALRLEKGEGSVRPPSEEEIAAAEKARLRRAAPRLPSLTANS